MKNAPKTADKTARDCSACVLNKKKRIFVLQIAQQHSYHIVLEDSVLYFRLDDWSDCETSTTTMT